MKRSTLYILILLLSGNAFGQLQPLACQYLNNTMALNPAFAGSHEALSTTVSYRNQWIGFNDAPVNLTMAAHAPMYNDRVGLGLMIRRNTVGIYNTTGIFGSYAYRLELHDGILSLGAAFGANFYNVQWNRLIAADPNDDLLVGNDDSAFLPDFSIGAYYLSDKWFGGISLPEFLSHNLNSTSGKYHIENSLSGYTLMVLGGYYLDLNDDMTLLPSGLVKLNPEHKSQLDLNTQLIFKDRVWVGAGYRSSGALVGMLQCQVNYQLRLAYSYDFDLGQIGRYSSGSHEAVLSYVFSYVRKAGGPRNF